MRRQSGRWRLVAAFVGLALAWAATAQTAEVYIRDTDADTDTDDDELTVNSGAPTGNLPVLFVHGHGFGEATSYQNNWQDDPAGNSLTSFKQALLLNEGLGIEEYYISLPNEDDRSITDDARDIRDAVNLILERHDPGFHSEDAASTTHVKVVIIAYSQGTISTRLYLKSLCVRDSRCQSHDPVAGLDPPRQQDFRPVSEFIAIAPPNHGIDTSLFATTTSLTMRELYNGYRPQGVIYDCGDPFNEPAGTDYIKNLNGHPIEDTEALSACEFYPSEAPGSRSPISPPTEGVLYVTLFDDQNRDFVGGDVASSDCQGRRLALNLSPNAVNIPVSSITGDTATAVHRNTVHTPEVICQALYAAVHHRSPLGQTCNPGINGIPKIPPPTRAAAMLTLDFSASMALPACPGCTNTRADELKDSVELFVQTWSTINDGNDPNDRLGVTYFRTNIDQFNLAGDTLPLLTAGGDSIRTDVARPTQTPSNRTAMGGGLQRAIEALRNPSIGSDIRRVILFTDGIQNVNPMVQSVACDKLVIENESGRLNSNVSPTAPPTVLDPSLGIAVDTIGIGAGDAFATLLHEIATGTGGRTWLTMAPDEELRRSFVEALINALRGSSPQLVAYRHGSIGSAGSTEAFAIDHSVRKLVLELSWKRGDKIDFSVIKDGFDVTSAGRFIDGAFYKIFVINLPAKGRSPINARGNWQLRIKGKKATAYEIAAIVDGGRIAYDAMFNAKRPKVGDPLKLVVRSTIAGKPIGAGARVTATLMMPTITPGEIIAANPPKEITALEPGMSVAERQLLALTQDPKNLAKLRAKPQTAVLKRSDKGIFSTRLNPQVPGIYTAVVTIDGETAKIGKFSRTMTVTTVVRAQKPNEHETNKP